MGGAPRRRWGRPARSRRAAATPDPRGRAVLHGHLRIRRPPGAFRATRECPRRHLAYEGELLYPFSTGKPSQAIAHVEHDFSFRDDLRVISGGEVVVHAADGTADTISITPVTNFWPGFAGYDEYRGYASGQWRVPSYADSFIVDTGDLAEVAKVSMLSESFCRCAAGIRSAMAWSRWCSWAVMSATGTPGTDDATTRGGRDRRAARADRAARSPRRQPTPASQTGGLPTAACRPRRSCSTCNATTPTAQPR